ncbi:MAG: HEAT repeat domain-containing protein [Anaerolineae bacterium]|nr:HEAT repeat domain-containing protein [Anaerolineae bacterium]
MPEQTHQVKQVIAELRDVNKERRRTAIMKLGMIGGEEALRILIYVVSNKHEDLIVRGRAALMLGNMRDTRAVEPLIEALAAPGYQTPLFAAEALGKIGDPKAIPALEILLQSEHERYREVAGQALQRLQRKNDEQQQEVERAPEPSA